jgi:DNA-binding MarR family transcriptional regulator
MERYLDIGRSCACGNLRRAARVITQVYDRFLRPSGLKATQFGLLITIKTLGSVTVTKLAQKSAMDRTTCTRNLRVLEENAFISLEQTEDKRVKKVSLTDKGHEVLEAAIPLWENAQKHVIQKFGEDRITNILHELSEMISRA